MQTLAGSSDRESMIRVSKKLLSNMAALRELALELTGEEWRIEESNAWSNEGIRIDDCLVDACSVQCINDCHRPINTSGAT